MSGQVRWERPQIDFVDPRQLSFVEPRTRGELPHLYKEGGSYFCTFRLWDAVISKDQQETWQSINRKFNLPANQRDLDLASDLAASVEPPLKLGSCLLQKPALARIVENSLLFFHNQRYKLTAWCVMPNHVHVTYTAMGAHTPENIHHSWKSYSSHAINKLLNRNGGLWERESFDHLIRSEDHYEFYME